MIVIEQTDRSRSNRKSKVPERLLSSVGKETQHILVHLNSGFTDVENAKHLGKKLENLLRGSGTELVIPVWRNTNPWKTISNELKRVSASDVFGLLFDAAERGIARWLSADDNGKSTLNPAPQERVEHELSAPLLGTDLWLASRLESSKLPAHKLESLTGAITQEEKVRFTRFAQDQIHLNDTFGIDLEIADYEFAKQYRGRRNKAGEVISFLAIAAGHIVLNSLKRLVCRTHHGWRATITEEVLRELGGKILGGWFWDGVKQQAQELFDERSANSLPAIGAQLLIELERLQQKHPHMTIDISCHSGGAIALCHLVNSMALTRRAVRLRHLVFLAPACSTSLFESTVLAHRERFEQAHLFTMADDYEQRDAVVPVIYPRSMLYLVSGLFEDSPATPLLGLSRYLDKKIRKGDETLRRVATFFEDDSQGNLILSPTSFRAISGRRSMAVQHHAFDEENTTLESLAQITKEHARGNLR